MKKFSRLTIIAVALMVVIGTFASAADTYDVAAYYWPSCHFDERWATFFPDGSQGEWESIRNCKPKWDGHYQPRVPAWGYLMDNDPAAMEKKIDAATSHGVNVMLFDWYWFENKPFLESALNDGFLKAKNVDKMKFYLMWANHDAKTSWDIRRSHERVTIWPGSVDLPTFKTIVARVIKQYFSHSSYYKIDGKPVFSIYDMHNLIKGLGGVKQTVEALDYFRSEVKKAGFPGLHIQMIYWGRVPKIDDSGFASKKGTAANTIKTFKIDSVTNYQFVHLARPEADYVKWADKAVSNWPKWSKEFDVPYFPHVSIGWDNNARFVRKMGAVTDNVNPETFKKYLVKAKAYADAHPDQPKLITINAWNEWVEGSYLEPDERFGMGYLEAVRDVFVSPENGQDAKADVPAQVADSPAKKAKPAEPTVPKPTLTEVRYGEHERNVLDFWKANSRTPTPLVFVIHGGGWKGGSKERVGRFVNVEQLLAAGISVVAINYRFVSHAAAAGIKPPVKAPLHDAARALQFVRSKASEWNIDKARIGAAGGSAGACSSLWLAYHDDLADPKSSDPIARESTRLQCAAVIGAQTTLDPQQMKEWTPNSKYGGHAFGRPGFEEFLRDRNEILPWIAEYSPYALVTADDPPVCLLYSTPPALGQVQKDPTHTANFGAKLQEKCNSIGVACEFVYTATAKVRHIMASDYLIKNLKAPAKRKYSDGRPAATLRMDAKDHGIVLRYGDGPGKCDYLGARDVWVFEDGGTYYMHYDAAGPKGWLCSLAVSKDLLTWEKKGPVLDFGKPGEDDSKSASYGVTYNDGKQWHMFYLGTPNASREPDRVPSFPYLTMKAKASGPEGPWIKQKDVVPFRTKPNTYYSITASPGHVIKNGDEYLQFFSSTTRKPENRCVQRTLGIARTKDLDGPWTVDPKPMVPIEEQIENSTLYYEKSNKTWFLFTNHIGIDKREYTDAIWVYWSKDLNKWDPANKAVVLDGQNCSWSKKCIGLPSVLPASKRLALFYDAPEGNSTSHMKRHIGLAWLDLPLSVPKRNIDKKRDVFKIQGRTAFLILPENIKSDKPTPWVWYAPTIGKHPDKTEKWMFDQFVNNGIAIAGVDVGESQGNPEGRAIYSALYKELVEKRGLSKKPSLLARSRGGLMLYNWAAENPQSVACIAGIYPVGNLASYPGLKLASAAYGMTEEQLAAKLTEHNPIDRLGPLAKAKVPIFHIHGDKDVTVPLDKNSAIVKKRYDKLGGQMILEVVKGQGHNMWSGWFHSQNLVDFVIANAREDKANQHTDLCATDLKCEYLTDPSGIDKKKPRLSWQLESGLRRQRQTAYHLLVAGSRDKLDKNVGDLWDTRKVQSDQSIHLAYNGKPLQSRIQCFWKVMVWDKDGKPSGWSKPAMWSMGLLKPEDWTARWITNPAPKRLSYPWLRRTFDLKENIERAVIHVNTPSYYQLHINGKKVSPYVLTPGISKIDKRFLINTYDVTSYLVKGTNCIALWMGPGWYQPRIGNKYNAPILRAQLDIHSLSGLTVIGTDSRWRVQESCISQIGGWEWNDFGGEHFDGRKFVLGWDQADLDDSNWLRAREIPAPDVEHSWQGCESARLSRPVSPKKIFQLKNGKWVIDFGRPLTGWMRLHMHGLKEGQEVKIIYADVNDNDNVRKLAFMVKSDGFQSFNQEDVFISAGNGTETFCSKFNYHSFRYAVISGLSQKPAIKDAAAMMIEPELESAGSFECSNDLFNQIHEITRYTLRTQNPGLALGTGEAREKSAYGDGGAHLSGYLYNFKCAANFRKWIRDWSDGQRQDGWFGHTAPAFEDHGGGPAWGGQVTELVRRMQLYYGDNNIVEQMYGKLAMYVDFIESKTHDRILRSYTPTEREESWMFIGDWARPNNVPGKGFNMDSKAEREFFNNCYRVLLWQQLQDYAKTLGRDDEYKRCSEHLATIRSLIHKTFYQADKGTYTFNNQSCLSMALYARIPPRQLRPKILAQLEHEIMVNKNGHLDTGLLGTFIMLDLLIKEDRNDLIALIMGQTTYPGWGYLIKEMDLNTWPETWSGWGSHVILVTATPGAWFFEGLGGILPDYKYPGFKHFTLRPGIVDSVDWVNCSYQSPYGKIVSNWKLENGLFTWDITVPPNTTATVYVPARRIEDVTESGKKIGKASGVKFLRMEKTRAVFAVESGRFEFESVVK